MIKSLLRYFYISYLLPGAALVLIVSFVFVAGCGSFKSAALEGDHSVGVIIEGSHSELLEPLLAQSLEHEIYTPQPEKLFEPFFAPDDSLSRFALWQNLMLVGTLDSNDPVSNRLKKMLKGDVLQGVEEGRYFIFEKQDIWSRGQTVVFLVGNSAEGLAEWIRQNGSDIYQVFANSRDEKMKREIFSMLEQKSLSDSLRKAHGWSMRIQHDYVLTTSKKSPSFIRLRRSLPDRFITVGWKIGDAEDVSLSNFFEWRDELGSLFADSIRVNPDISQSQMTELNGIQALKVHGLWETYGNLGGGPFVAYMLHHGDTIYLLDGQVFAPDRSKELFIRQMDIILNTFEPPLN